ncbi:SOS response-associated peptidase [Haliscomenobacter hydrossis]|nr:SOS response-associated peptidase [Haliscomenobacter hydrossis]
MDNFFAFSFPLHKSTKVFFMCGRYSFSKSKVQIEAELGVSLEAEGELIHNYNIAPTQQTYVISNQRPGALQLFQWGLIPSWSKDPKMGGKLINARAETVMDKPSFRTSIRQRRCLVLADSFYEWKKEGKEKTPFRIFPRNGELLVMGGIWDTWKGEGKVIHSFSIITTGPNQEMIPIHDRMPLVLPGREAQKLWLEEKDPAAIAEMLHTPGDWILDMYPVSDRVNSVRNNGVELQERVG